MGGYFSKRKKGSGMRDERWKMRDEGWKMRDEG
jgi:hypothetical protein